MYPPSPPENKIHRCDGDERGNSACTSNSSSNSDSTNNNGEGNRKLDEDPEG